MLAARTGCHLLALSKALYPSAVSLLALEGCWASHRQSHTFASEPVSVPSPRKMVQPFDEIPGHWKNGWVNLYHFWRQYGPHNMHNHMVKNFQEFGPIYREKLGSLESVYVIQPEDAAEIFKVEGTYPERFNVPPWVAYRDFRNNKYGVLLNSGKGWRSDRLVLNREVFSLQAMERFAPLLNEVSDDMVKWIHDQIKRNGSGQLTADFTNYLFRYSLEAISYLLYGARLGLLKENVHSEAQIFIDAVAAMFNTSPPMIYIPPKLLRSINSKIWINHVKAWDVIFAQADKYIQDICNDVKLNQKSCKEHPGILARLLMQDTMQIDELKASTTEMMAGGVDTISMTLQWAMYDLARYPMVQDKLRTEILAAKAAAQGDLSKLLKTVPLVKAAIKETLRLHPLAASVQRYIKQETVIRNYLIPAGTLVQVGIYAMGRDPTVFAQPDQFIPERWLEKGSHHFRGLSFGFGIRQCLGRRIAEVEMQLFLIHMLENFKIEDKIEAEVKTTFDLILIPSRPIHLTLLPLV